MKVAAAIPVALLTSSLFAGTAVAEWRCDCTTILDSCSASVQPRESWVEVTTDHPQCARVDYLIDGLPFVSLVVEGEGREDWISRSSSPQVIVQSCQVCRDNAADGAGPGAVAAAPVGEGEGTLEPLIETQPSYPEAAQASGIEGSVTVEFVVTPFGNVESARVTSAEPSGVFDMAAISAISRWRYPANPDREPQTLSETIEFRLVDFIWDLPVSGARSADTGRRVARAMNQCIRENISYNYGEMIEVGLMNACEEPVILFACAGGTGPNANRWVCADSESQTSVLVAPGRSRPGAMRSIDTPEGRRTYDLSDSFFISRAPNTEYWWLACEAGDLACRSDGRQWLRAIDRQTASIDPQQRARLPVSRSY